MLLRALWEDARELAQSAYGNTAVVTRLRTVAAVDSYRILALHRLRESVKKRRIPLANHMLRMVQTSVLGIELGKAIELGSGVYFVHPIGTVVGGTSKVGDRVRFYGCNTVGSAHDDGCPTIGDDVQVGAGARLLGPITIGDGAHIGANAVVTCDVPAGAVAVGIPAKVRLPKAKPIRLVEMPNQVVDESAGDITGS